MEKRLGKAARISLKERVNRSRGMEDQKPDFLNVFEIFLDEYFEGLFSISRNPRFREIYEKEFEVQGEDADQLLAVYLVWLGPENLEDSEWEGAKGVGVGETNDGWSKEQEKTAWLRYRILIEPFVRISEF